MRPGPATLLVLLGAATAGITAPPARAIDSIRMQAADVAVAGQHARDIAATLSIRSATHSDVSIHAAAFPVPDALVALAGPQVALRIDCKDPLVHEPRFECGALTLQAWTQRWPPLTVRGAVTWRSDNGLFIAQGTGPDIADSPFRFSVKAGQDAQAQLELPSLSLAALATLLKPWISLPGDLEISGTGTLSAVLKRSAGANTADVALVVRQAALNNAAYTWVGEKLEATARARLDLTRFSAPGGAPGFEVEVHGLHGQFLGGPMLLDFDRNPLALRATGTYGDGTLRLPEISSTQRDLLTMTGTAEIGVSPFHVRTAEIVASEILFPAAYASYLQLTLATTPFNQLVTQGKAHATLRMQDDQPVQLHLTVEGLEFRDDARELRVVGVDSELYWMAGATGPPRPSFVSWESAQGWGILGAKSRVDFLTNDRDFRLLKAARLPLFDGALIVNAFAVERAGQPDMAGDFDAVIEPISVAPITKALQWPEFGGQLSGRIPGLTYRNGVLSLEGDLEASVFDGTMVASNLRVRDPLGKWPRLYADIIAFNLDLELVTRTFEFGSITGRLDVDLKGLETFNWSPVAFDLRMATPKDDHSPHRISQRAVANLSNIGGGGGGVATALQSGALKFFDTFKYDQIGLSCRLRNDVCRMSGVAPAGNGYYILRGAGLPHLDIIGKSTLVDWPRFVSQIAYGINNSGSIVVN